MTALRVGRLVADHPGPGEGDGEVIAGAQQKSRGRLSAFALSGIAWGEPFGVVEAITETSKVNVRRSQLCLQFVLDRTDGVVA
jgi:hypothetical protein